MTDAAVVRFLSGSLMLRLITQAAEIPKISRTAPTIINQYKKLLACSIIFFFDNSTTTNHLLFAIGRMEAITGESFVLAYSVMLFLFCLFTSGGETGLIISVHNVPSALPI